MQGLTQSIEPAWIARARRELGVKEMPGPGTNPRVAEYLAAAHARADDEIPWCSAFVNWVLREQGLDVTGRLAARSWMRWGVATQPRLGAVCSLWREKPDGLKGHVGFFLRFDEHGRVVLLGGNQANEVCERPYPAFRVLGFRWPTLAALTAAHLDTDGRIILT